MPSYSTWTIKRGELRFTEHTQELLVGISSAAWKALIPPPLQRKLNSHDLHRYDQTRHQRMDDADLADGLNDLRASSLGRPSDDVVALTVTVANRDAFRRRFREVLAASRDAGDEGIIELEPARTIEIPGSGLRPTEIPAVTAPASDIREELEAIARQVPSLNLDPAEELSDAA